MFTLASCQQNDLALIKGAVVTKSKKTGPVSPVPDVNTISGEAPMSGGGP